MSDAFRFNVRNLTIDFLVKDDITGVIYESTPEVVPGTMEIGMSPKVASAALYGDGTQRHQENKISGYDVTLEHNKLPPPLRARMRGQRLDTNTGMYISSADDVAAEFAIGWTVDLTDGHVEVTWLPKGKAVPSDKNVQQTEGENINYSTDSLVITAMPLEYNKHFEYIADTSDTASGFTHAKAATFFDKVPVLPPRSAVDPGLGETPEPGETEVGITTI
ncbi:MAG: hypothetical protein FWE42_05705 [Defluviitaleaceae bacterium]|nr:hypothetical protein [Defluviitaleaceae bacterium]